MAKNKKNIEWFDNSTRYKIEYNRLMNWAELMAINVFKWEGFPDFFRSAYVERLLFNNPIALAFMANFEKEQADGFMILPAVGQGQLNVIGEFSTFRAISPQKQFKRDFSDCVVLRANELYIPMRDRILPLIEEMADIRVAIAVNRGASCKTPLYINTDSDTELSALNEARQIIGNKPIILKKRGMTTGFKTEYESRPPYWGRELEESYNVLKTELLTTIGVISNPIVKRERVNTLEASSNRGELVDSLDIMLAGRQECAAQINDMFGEYLQGTLGLPPVSCTINNVATEQLYEDGILAQPTNAPAENGEGVE